MANKTLDEKAIFNVARQLGSQDARVEYLRQTCGADSGLRERVQVLLRAYEEQASFLESPPPVGLAPTIDQPASECPGTLIGPYKLLEQIGEGGFGVVFMAEQAEPIRRKVALKVLKAGMDTKQVIARFEAERQALALMDHPNIAHVFDGGQTPSGRPYFVMELVRGCPITEYCDQQHLGIRERLGLFMAVCQAVQHAHQKGVIHRDIKPSNVLVVSHDGTPVPKVIDFGIAKALSGNLTDKTLFTGFAQMVGTPLYMSPEQAGQSGLDVDTRSDIYSLGVLLYELLTGTTPFDKEQLSNLGYDEMRRVIREEEPPRPSKRLSTLQAGELSTVAGRYGVEPRRLTGQVRGELDWIVMKALDKDRNRRYETANGFAADVQRYLADEAVLACPASVGYRLRKFVRRNKPKVAFAGVVLLFLIALGMIGGWAMRDRTARQAQVEWERAERQARVTAQVDLILAESHRLMADQKWPEALAAAKRAEAALAGGEADTAAQERVRQTLADVELVQRLEEARLASVEGQVDDARQELNYDASDRAYVAAFQEAGLNFERMTVEEATTRIAARPRISMEVAAALAEWATHLPHTQKESARARVDLLRAVADAIDPDPLRIMLRGDIAPRTVKRPAKKLLDRTDFQHWPPSSLVIWARQLGHSGKADSAVVLLRIALNDHPSDFWINFELAHWLSECRPQRWIEATGCYYTAVSLRPRSAIVRFNLGQALRHQNRYDEAVACFRKAIELQPKMAKAYQMIGSVLQQQNKPQEALASCKEAIEINPKDAWAYMTLGGVLYRQKNLHEAVTNYRKAIDLDPKHGQAFYLLGAALGDLGRLDEAIPNYRKAIELRPTDAEIHHRLANALARGKKPDEAIPCYRKAIELDPQSAPTHGDLGRALQGKGQWQEALAAFEEAIRLKPEAARYHRLLAGLLATCSDLKGRDPPRALAAAKKAVQLDPQSVDAWQMLGWAQYRAGDWKASIQALEKSCKLQGDTGDCGQWMVLALAHGKLAGQKELPEDERGRHKAEARRWYDQAAKQSEHWREPKEAMMQAILAFRAEAETLLGPMNSTDPSKATDKIK